MQDAGAVKSHRVNFLTGQGLRRNFSTLRRSRTSNSKDLAAQVKVSSENPAAPSSTNGRKQPADGAPNRRNRLFRRNRGLQAGDVAAVPRKKWSGSVGRILSAVAGATVIPLGRRLPGGSSHLPARSSGRSTHRHRSADATRAYLMLLRMGFGLPLLSPAMR